MGDITNWGYPGLALAAFLAGTPFPMNSEVVLSGLLLLGFSPIMCIIVATFGNWLGAMVNYFLGRLCTYEQMLRWTRVNPNRLEKVKTFLAGRGAWCALASGVPLLGNVIIIAYGVLRVPLWRVAGIMFIGQIIRFSIWSVCTLGTWQMIR